MKIEEQRILSFISSELDSISYHDLPTHSHGCPHCGLQVRYEPIATRQDIEDFKLLMDSACKVLDDWGINNKLFAAIHAQIAVALANRRSRSDDTKVSP